MIDAPLENYAGNGPACSLSVGNVKQARDHMSCKIIFGIMKSVK